VAEVLIDDRERLMSSFIEFIQEIVSLFSRMFEKLQILLRIAFIFMSGLIVSCGGNGGSVVSVSDVSESEAYKNFYAVVWRGEPVDNLKFARQMGYRYVGYRSKMANLDEAEGMRFYVVNPELRYLPVSLMDLNAPSENGTQAQYEEFFTWKNNMPFPQNLASGWWYSDSRFIPIIDFQQQSVIDDTVEYILAGIKPDENISLDFRFAGLMWDVPDIKGDFWSGYGGSGGEFVDLSYWTGSDSCASLAHTHDYATYSDGKAAYFKTVYKRIREEYPDAKFISHPFTIYDRWIKDIENRADARELMPDLLLQEQSGTLFVDDERIFSSGLVTRNQVGTSTTRKFGNYENRLYAAKAAINGAWYNWFGNLGGDGDTPDYQNIYEVPARLQLIRVLPNWDNLAQIPLPERTWDGTVYESSNSYVDGNIIYSRQPLSGKLFVVFLDTAGRIKLKPNETVGSIHKTDGLFIETENGSMDLEVSGNEIRLINPAGLSDGYIITLL